MSNALVIVEPRGSIRIVTLNRPAQRNALSMELMNRLADVLDALAVDPTVRVLVLSGAGPVFCAGMDLREAADVSRTAESEQRAINVARTLADLIQGLHTLPCLTIAAVHGDALAGGAGLAMTCDLVVMDPRARIGYPEVLRGLAPAIVMQDLVRLVGERRARQLVLTGAPIDAATALAWGLANQITKEDGCSDEAVAMAERALAAAPIAVATSKRLLDEASRRAPDLRGAAAISASIRVSEEALEGIQAFLDKRAPRWSR